MKNMADKLYFTGTIETIFFSNPSNFYKVILLEVTDTNADFSDGEIVVNGIIVMSSKGIAISSMVN